MSRNKRLDIRLSPKERRALEILAKREGRKISELSRELIRSGIEAGGIQVVGLIDLLYANDGGPHEQQ